MSFSSSPPVTSKLWRITWTSSSNRDSSLVLFEMVPHFRGHRAEAVTHPLEYSSRFTQPKGEPAGNEGFSLVWKEALSSLEDSR